MVPRTTGCGLKRPELAEQEAVKIMDSQGGLHPLINSTIQDIFNKFDLVISQTIDFKEFKGLCDILGKPLLEEPQFKAQILAKYNSVENGLTLRGFREWWKA